MRTKKEEKNGKNFQQSTLLLCMVLGIIVIFTIVVGLSLYNIGSHLMSEADARYQLVTDNVAEEITTWFANQSQTVLSQKAAIEIEGDFDTDTLTKYLTTIVNEYNEDGYIYDLYFLNTDNVMSSGYGYIPDPSIDFRKRAWYKEALANNGIYYSSPYKDTNLDRYVVTISTPCYDSNNNLAGVLALDIFVDTLFSIANDRVLDGNSYVFLIDSTLGIVTHPNPEYSYINDEPIKASDVPDGKYEYIVDYIKGDMDAKATRSHYNVRDYDGINRSIYVSKIDSCGWYSVTAIESSVFIAPLLKTLLFIVIALLVCLIGGIITTRFITGRIIYQLNEANEAALAANETKSVFLANMSHEIRTPINAIIGMNEMVIRENNEPNINDYALDIASASRSLVTIVNDILDFSKIESGKMDLVETEFNIASIINDVVNMSESRLGNKELALFFDIDPNIPVGIMGDEVRIKQIILNMMTNAIKYTRSGHVTMRVEFTKQTYGINLNIFVKDTGIGISEENIEHLFESFQRFDTKRNRSIEGTGLGLSITKRLIQSMGGFINVTSKLGEGSEFSVSLPLKVVNTEPFVQLDNPEAVKMLALFDTASLNAENSTEATRITDKTAETLGLDFTRAKTFDEFSELISNIKYSHILIDHNIYFNYEDYFKKLSEDNTVIVLQKRGNAQTLPSTIVNFYTPLYVISLAGLINHKKMYELNESTSQLTFTAPSAKIMIVDDNELNLKVAAGLMRPYGMKITTVDSGVKAIKILSEDPTYDIVFMDHMMPIMDGIEATKKIRELEGDYYEKLPIIALTANTINNAKKMFLSSGFNDFLAKPININFLDRMLRAQLPKDKIIPSGGEKPTDTSSQSPVAISETSKKSEPVPFDYKTGLKYTGGSIELYLDILKEYVENAPSMKDILTTTLDQKDWTNYIIKVHALKSMSLTIGAVPLSELAKELELSGKAGNYEPIENKTALLMDKYDVVLKEATDYLAINNIIITPKTDSPDTDDVSEEFDKSLVLQYASDLLTALEEYDTDKANDIYKTMNNQQKLFATAISLINNFEYDKATEEIERIRKMYS